MEVSSWLYENYAVEDSFETSAAMEGCTQGIWVNLHPVIVKTTSGEEYAVFLLDTQGLFDPESSADTDSLLFQLTMRLCCVTIFNVFRSLEREQINFLASFAKLITGDQSHDALSRDLIILLRDASLGGEYYGWAAGAEYLKKALSFTDHSAENELMRAYRSIECFRMPKIAADPNDPDFRVTEEYVSPKFAQFAKEFLERVVSGTYMRPFQFAPGVAANAGGFASELRKIHFARLRDIFGPEKIGGLNNGLKNIEQTEMRQKKESAFKRYVGGMEKALENGPLPVKQLLQLHNELRQSCLKGPGQDFLSRDWKEAAPWIRALEEEIDVEFRRLQARNASQQETEDSHQQALERADAHKKQLEEAVERQRHQHADQMENMKRQLEDQRRQAQAALRDMEQRREALRQQYDMERQQQEERLKRQREQLRNLR
ncbi:atlastin-3-like isoform X2 [Paramacrobiotus metropolitanus]|nr:atlastin-3-like isoform X2 [Paramacrobiotus metropolitanus]